MQPADSLSGADLGRILNKVEIMELWIRAVREEASHRLDTGKEVPGWKLVQKRATRKWVDEPRAGAALIAAGLPPDALYLTELRSPAQIEKIAPKAAAMALKQVFADHVHAVSSGTTLAPESDARPAVASGAHAFADTPILPW